jgi:geranylgeranyl reductase family protein
MISIVGAGPAGNYTAYLLAKKGEKVSVFEEHLSIGSPVQCTGIVTSAIENIIPLKNRFVMNKINGFRIFSPNNKSILINLKKPNIILDRKEFDKYLAEIAESEGAKFYLGHRFINYIKKKNFYRIKFNERLFDSNVIIGADGPLSRVAKVSGLYGNRKFVIGLQARMALKHDPNIVDIYLDKNFFGWVVPENEYVVRAGIVSKEKPDLYFKYFLNKKIEKGKIRDYQSGLIPIYNHKLKTQKKNIYLIGDAATQVKATTYGGLVPSLISAQELSNSIIKNKDYHRSWKNRIGRELKYGLLIRNKLNKFSNVDYDKLIQLVNQDKVKYILSRYDRDYPSKLLFRLALREPRFLKYIF